LLPLALWALFSRSPARPLSHRATHVLARPKLMKLTSRSLSRQSRDFFVFRTEERLPNISSGSDELAEQREREREGRSCERDYILMDAIFRNSMFYSRRQRAASYSVRSHPESPLSRLSHPIRILVVRTYSSMLVFHIAIIIPRRLSIAMKAEPRRGRFSITALLRFLERVPLAPP